MPTADAVIRTVLRWLAVAAYTKAKPLIPSTVLADALRITNATVGPDLDGVSAFAPAAHLVGTIKLSIPHYWAVYIHDGRPAFGPRRANFLVWFADPSDDPRLAGGYPVRFADVKRLTKEQFHEGLAINRLRRAAGLPVFMHVAKIRRGDPPRKFFEDGLAGFSNDSGVADIALEGLRSYLLPKVKSKSDTARGRV